MRSKGQDRAHETEHQDSGHSSDERRDAGPITDIADARTKRGSHYYPKFCEDTKFCRWSAEDTSPRRQEYPSHQV